VWDGGSRGIEKGREAEEKRGREREW